MSSFLNVLPGVALALTALGCASVAPPVKDANQTEAAIRAADEVGAGAVPAATLHLKLARDQLEEGKALMADDRNEEARAVVSRARADAELAIAMAHSSEARIEAREMAEKLETLEKQAGR